MDSISYIPRKGYYYSNSADDSTTQIESSLDSGTISKIELYMKQVGPLISDINILKGSGVGSYIFYKSRDSIRGKIISVMLVNKSLCIKSESRYTKQFSRALDKNYSFPKLKITVMSDGFHLVIKRKGISKEIYSESFLDLMQSYMEFYSNIAQILISPASKPDFNFVKEKLDQVTLLENNEPIIKITRSYLKNLNILSPKSIVAIKEGRSRELYWLEHGKYGIRGSGTYKIVKQLTHVKNESKKALIAGQTCLGKDLKSYGKLKLTFSQNLKDLIALLRENPYETNLLHIPSLYKTLILDHKSDPKTIRYKNYLICDLYSGDITDINYQNLSISNVFNIVNKMIEATKQLHMLGFAHGDIKPDNFLFDFSDVDLDEYKIMLTDFDSVFKVDLDRLYVIDFGTKRYLPKCLMFGRTQLEHVYAYNLDCFTLITSISVLLENILLESKKLNQGNKKIIKNYNLILMEFIKLDRNYSRVIAGIMDVYNLKTSAEIFSRYLEKNYFNIPGEINSKIIVWWRQFLEEMDFSGSSDSTSSDEDFFNKSIITLNNTLIKHLLDNILCLEDLSNMTEELFSNEGFI